MRILVTGGGGMIGINLLEELTDYTVFAPSRGEYNLESMEQTRKMFNRYRPEVVVHLAAKVGGLFYNTSNNYSMLNDNTLINMHVIECCRLFNVKTLVNILSTCVFPDKVKYPLKSEYILDGPPNKTNEGYATSKRLLYTASKLLSESSDTRVTNLIPTNIYGKYDNFDPLESHVIPGMILKLYYAKINDTNFTVNGQGKALRQFVYASDFARVIKYFMFEDHDTKQFKSIIVSPPESDEVSIRDLSFKIKEIYGLKNNIVFTEASEGQMKKTTNDMELREYLPNFQFTSLVTGLKSTIGWFKRNVYIEPICVPRPQCTIQTVWFINNLLKPIFEKEDYIKKAWLFEDYAVELERPKNSRICIFIESYKEQSIPIAALFDLEGSIQKEFSKKILLTTKKAIDSSEERNTILHQSVLVYATYSDRIFIGSRYPIFENPRYIKVTNSIITPDMNVI